MTGIGIFATIYLTPVFLGRVRGFSALEIGLAVFSTGVFQILAIPLYALLANRVDLRWLMMFGPGLLRAVDVVLRADHPRLGRVPADAAAGAARHRPAVRRGARP
jgi:predicted MFS family arabinose efflux permease